MSTTRAKKALRKLDTPLTLDDIKKCAYQFNIQASGQTDIDISQIDGQTVLLRSPNQTTLDADWHILTQIATTILAKPNPHGPKATFYQSLNSDPDRLYTRPQTITDSSLFKKMVRGKFALINEGAELLYDIDRLFRPLIRREQATHFYSEPLWEEEDLHKFGYKPEGKNLWQFRGHNHTQNFFWQNATCNNIWKSLENYPFQHSRTFTALNTCSRNEGSQHFLLEYMKIFKMREVVCVGTPDQVLAFRDRALTFVAELCQEIGFNGFFQEANDPFFLEHSSDPDEDITLPALTKIELRLNIYDNRSLACASFNIHGNFFAHKFGYQNEYSSQPLWTSCIAFGLERWVWAIFIQFGTDPEQWPTKIKDLLY
ncbi:MAG TPA: hypothetical protein VLL52_23515 [Anaerolineae bacterium]|nr:hypothetical protein [Anaerolineae bacterium]